MKGIRGFCIFVFSLSSCLCPLHPAEVTPVGDFRFLGGQHFFNDTPSSLSGNCSFTLVPAIRFNDSFSLMPGYLGAYHGAKEANDLAGGDTLFQDSQYHVLSVKGIYSPVSVLKLKLGASCRVELLRETKDENWGSGLFDYRKLNGGFETEYFYSKKHSLRCGLDLFTITFPNYQTLESSAAAAGLGRELAGTDALNTLNTMLSLRLADTWGRVKTELGYSMTTKSFPDQPLILASGLLSAEKRKDSYSAAQGSISCPFLAGAFLRLMGELEMHYVLNDSDQGNYDAKKATQPYTADFYDFETYAAGPALHFIAGKAPCAVTLSYTLSRREYKERRAQDTGGAALDDTVQVNEGIAGISIAYPLTRNFRLRFAGTYVESVSNMKYETVYAWNYRTAQYLMGFSYEF